SFKSDANLVVLDYGCGGSPYRSLFPNSDYRRADFGETRGLDYVIGNDSRIPEVGETFDLVLSTQVLEHVQEPSTYLSECYRLLKPKRLLICSTHGSYEDHGCPYDFRRWTADGLSRDLHGAGFNVTSLMKVTTGPRALLALMERFRWTLRGSFSRKTRFGLGWWFMESTLNTKASEVHALSDAEHSGYRVVDAAVPDGNHPAHAIYLCLVAGARKSGRTPTEI